MKKIITLLTDYGMEDYYEALVLGRIYQVVSDVQVITLHVKKYDIIAAGFSLAQYYKEYPEGTLHIVLVNDGHLDHQDMIVFKIGAFYLQTYNNGIVSYLNENPVHQWIVPSSGILFPSFKELDLVSKVVEAWEKGQIEKMFLPLEAYETSILLQPIPEKDRIVGHIVYIDSYGNCITNVHVDLFLKYSSFKQFDIVVGKHRITGLARDYSEVGSADLMALFGHHGYLEIANAKEKADTLLGLKIGSTIRIEFR